MAEKIDGRVEKNRAQRQAFFERAVLAYAPTQGWSFADIETAAQGLTDRIIPLFVAPVGDATGSFPTPLPIDPSLVKEEA